MANILISIFFLIAILVSTESVFAQLLYENPSFEWKDNRDPESPRPSPNAFAGLQIGSTRITISYGSPAIKGRKIFGGLVPYGVVWRTGANEATTITFSEDALVEGHEVSAGTYSSTLLLVPIDVPGGFKPAVVIWQSRLSVGDIAAS